jgi:histone H3
MSKTKKQFRYFDSYLPTLLRTDHPNNGLTTNARQQLNSCLCYLAKSLSADAKNLAKVANKRTIAESDILSAVELRFSDAMFIDTMKANTDAVTNFTSKSDSDKKGESRQSKAGLTLPPSITEKFLREFGTNSLMVTGGAPITLCVALEVFTKKLFADAVPLTEKKKKKRVTIRDLELAVRGSELDKVIKDAKIRFLGGGIVPFIHPLLTVKKPRRKKRSTNDSGEPKKHRFKPGTVALRDIKKLQRVYNHLVLAKSPFEKMIREVLENNGCEAKISKQVFTIMQYYLESYLLDIIHQSNLAALHANRVKMLPEDIDFVLSLDKRTLPLKIEVMKELDEEEDEEDEGDEVEEDEDEVQEENVSVRD